MVYEYYGLPDPFVDDNYELISTVSLKSMRELNNIQSNLLITMCKCKQIGNNNVDLY